MTKQHIPAHERTPGQVVIVYTCQRCTGVNEYVGYPTKKPKYCPTCAQVVRREQNREAQRRRRGKV